jgi:hypothetical protein
LGALLAMPEQLIKAIAGALIPAAMVTASAVILQGIWAEHRALADRIRACSAELRAVSTHPRRRHNLVAQLASFRRRVRMSTMASLAASGSVACFVTLMLSIALHESVRLRWLVLVAFVTGAALLLVAISLVFGDLLLARRTLDIELEDCALDATQKRDHPR